MPQIGEISVAWRTSLLVSIEGVETINIVSSSSSWSSSVRFVVGSAIVGRQCRPKSVRSLQLSCRTSQRASAVGRRPKRLV